MVVGVSLSSAQHSEVTPQANDRGGNLSVGLWREAPAKGMMIDAQGRVKDTGSVLVKFSDEGNSRQSGSKSFLTSVREEMTSLADRLPELSVSWLGVSCYVRNPLRYKLSPGSTYAHQMGFSAGDWFLSVDGIKTDTFEDLRIALQCPVGKRINVFVGYSDMQYKVDVHAIGKLPWE
jgi:hypothetical protein